MIIRTVRSEILIALLVLVLTGAFSLSCFAGEDVSLAYSGYGGQGTISGSLHVLHVDDDRYLIDAGLFMGGDGSNYPWPSGIPVESVRAVFITHAHADHAGRIPLLLREGYGGPIYMTEVTRDILRATLPGNISWADFGRERFYYSRHNEGKRRIPVYLEGYDFGEATVRDYNRVFIEMRRPDLGREGYYLHRAQVEKLREELLERLDEQVRVLSPREVTAVGSLEVEFILTSHIPGSVMVAISVAGRELLFSGDLGSDSSPLFEPNPVLDRTIDYLWLEGTYADPRGTDYEDERREFRNAIGGLLGKGYRVIIPAFVLDRTQQVLFEIGQGMKEGSIPDDRPVKVYSRSANELTRLYRDWASNPDVVREYFSGVMMGQRFSAPRYEEPRVGWSDDDPLKLGHGEIGIMSSGMAEYAFARRAVEDYGSDRNTAFQFVSYLAPGTPGRQMLDGSSGVTFSDGGRASIRALSRSTGAFSGHADPGQIVEIFAGCTIGRLFLVHVDETNIPGLSKYYRDALDVTVEAPKPGEVIELQQAGRNVTEIVQEEAALFPFRSWTDERNKHGPY